MVRSAGIELATLSLEDRSGHTRHNKFKTLSVQDTARCILFTPIDAPPAHYLFTLAEPNASLTRGHGKPIVKASFSALWPRLTDPSRRAPQSVQPTLLRTPFTCTFPGSRFDSSTAQRAQVVDFRGATRIFRGVFFLLL